MLEEFATNVGLPAAPAPSGCSVKQNYWIRKIETNYHISHLFGNVITLRTLNNKTGCLWIELSGKATQENLTFNMRIAIIYQALKSRRVQFKLVYTSTAKLSFPGLVYMHVKLRPIFDVNKNTSIIGGPNWTSQTLEDQCLLIPLKSFGVFWFLFLIQWRNQIHCTVKWRQHWMHKLNQNLYFTLTY